jgi:predicted amidohydrolase YtcJ
VRADVVLVGGSVLTMDEAMDARRPAPTAIALRGDRVLAVGDEAEALARGGHATTVIPTEGRTVCPGFVDAHHHFTLAAWCQLGVNLAGCRSAAEAAGRLAAAAARGAPRTGAWCYAYNYAPRRFTHGPPLTRRHLDAAAGDRPALAMHFTYHEGVASSAGLRAAGIDRRTRDPAGGRVVRDRHGEPTGLLLETAVGPVEGLARAAAGAAAYDDWLAATQRYADELFAAGITHVCDPGVDAPLEGYLRRARREGRLAMPVTMLFMHGRGLFQPPRDRLAGPVTGERVDDLAVGALKIFADGGTRCAACIGLFEALGGLGALVLRAARLRRPGLLLDAGAPDRPRPAPGGRICTGYLHYTAGELARLCAEAAARGFQLATHAECNAAIDDVLAAYAPLPRGPYPHRIEHLVSLDAAQARRLGDAGIVGVVQPAYVAALGDEIDAIPAPPRLRSIPLRTLLDAGVPLAGSSDAPVAPFAPLHGMQAAVTRRTDAGYAHRSAEAITPLEALRLWTTGAALAVNQAGELGVLRPGARADLVVLDADPLRTPPERLGAIRVTRTIVGGRTVFVDEPVPTRDGGSATNPP